MKEEGLSIAYTYDGGRSDAAAFEQNLQDACCKTCEIKLQGQLYFSNYLRYDRCDMQTIERMFAKFCRTFCRTLQKFVEFEKC